VRLKLLAFAIFIVLLTICLLLFECYLGYSQHLRVKKHCAQFGITESRVEAARGLGVKISVNGRWYRELGLKPPIRFPIATHPNSVLIGFKEGDGTNWPVHTSDQYGYFNDPLWWNAPELVVVGDSFVSCEHLQTNSITLQLRQRGIRAVNVGLTGSGPLLQLAALKSQWWCLSHSVKRIVWVLYEGNDYQDAMEENEVKEYRDALTMFHYPDPSLLKELPNNDDQKLFGWRYIIRSVATLKRTRLVFRSLTGVDKGVDVWNDCLDEGRKLAPITLIRIKKLNMNFDRQWKRINKVDAVIELPCKPEYYSGGWMLSHLNHEGYARLADMMVYWQRRTEYETPYPQRGRE
jgi:hypothetical protein